MTGGRQAEPLVRPAQSVTGGLAQALAACGVLGHPA